MMRYELEPVGFGCDLLATIELDLSSNEVIVLGRNPTTLKATSCSESNSSQYATYMPSSHLDIIVENCQIFARPVGTNKMIIKLNGLNICSSQHEDKKQRIVVGDILSLVGTHYHFNYKLKKVSSVKRKLETVDSDEVQIISPVHKITTISTNADTVRLSEFSDADSEVTIISPPLIICDTEYAEVTGENLNATKSQHISLPVPPVQLEQTRLSEQVLNNHLECAICFNFIAFAHNLTPCGDTFCYECILNWSSKCCKCPNCNEEYDATKLITNRVLDNIVRDLLEGRATRGVGVEASCNSSSRGGDAINEEHNAAVAELKSWNQRMEQSKALKKILADDAKGSNNAITSSSSNYTRSYVPGAHVNPTARINPISAFASGPPSSPNIINFPNHLSRRLGINSPGRYTSARNRRHDLQDNEDDDFSRYLRIAGASVNVPVTQATSTSVPLTRTARIITSRVAITDTTAFSNSSFTSNNSALDGVNAANYHGSRSSRASFSSSNGIIDLT